MPKCERPRAKKEEAVPVLELVVAVVLGPEGEHGDRCSFCALWRCEQQRAEEVEVVMVLEQAGQWRATRRPLEAVEDGIWWRSEWGGWRRT